MTPDYPVTRFSPSVQTAQSHWPVWSAACMTRVGEQRSLRLNDNIVLMMNSNTALDRSSHNNSQQIQLHRGEIRINNSGAAQLQVDTPHGRIGGVTASFNISINQHWTQLQLYSGNAWLRSHHGVYRALAGGDVVAFSHHSLADEPMMPLNPAWTYGMLLADKLPLPVFLSELRRYWPGYLSMGSGLDALQVSGAFPLNHLNAVLDVIADTLPVRISRCGRKRVSIQAV